MDPRSIEERIKETGARLEAEYGVGNVAAVHYKGGGVAFFRAPTAEAHDSFVLFASDDKADQSTKTKAQVAYVRSCFVESLGGGSFEQVCAVAGVVWAKGPAMRAVNKIGGAVEEAPTVFSFR